MAHKIIMPKQGLQMTEGLITRWLVPEGGKVTAGEPLFEMETDKLTITIDATSDGTLLKILHGETETVAITKTIAIVGDEREDISALLAEEEVGGGKKEEMEYGKRPDAAAPALEGPPRNTAVASVTGGDRVMASPWAKTLAKERNVDWISLCGTGPDGLVVGRDVPAPTEVAASPLARSEAVRLQVDIGTVQGSGTRGKVMAADVRTVGGKAPRRGNVRIPLTGMRRMIAQRMHSSLQAQAQANHRITVDMTNAANLREQFKACGKKVSYNDLILRCTACALAEMPGMNVSMEEDAIIQWGNVNLGVAVAIDEGLLVPVLRNANHMSLTDISAATADLAARARTGRLQPDEMTGGTFTVSNLGMFGLESFTAIVNAPEAAILAVGRIAKKAVIVGDDIVARPVMELTLSYDHRIVDGAPAAQFLSRVRQLLENPVLLVLDNM